MKEIFIAGDLSCTELTIYTKEKITYHLSSYKIIEYASGSQDIKFYRWELRN